MKKVFLFLLCALCLLACQQKKEDGFTIQGTLQGDADGGRVMLQSMTDPPVMLDSVVVKDGKFTLKGKVDAPAMCSMVIDINEPDAEEPDYHNKMFNVRFYLENSDMTFEGDIATLPSYYYNPERSGDFALKGSASQDLYNALNAAVSGPTKELGEWSRKYSEEYIIPEMEGKDVTERGIEIVKAEKPLSKQVRDIKMKFIKENAASVVAFDEVFYIINGYSYTPTSAEIDELMALLEGPWAGTKQFEELKEIAATTKKLAIGEPYIDVELLNTKGEKVKLSSLVEKDKYVMLEFWASWCGPCRGEIPHLVKVHNKYKDFQIISISVDDKDSDWKKAMKEEGMVWTQLRNPDGLKGVVQEVYNITGVPTCILLDKEGNFYKTNMRGAYLDEFLVDTYGK